MGIERAFEDRRRWRRFFEPDQPRSAQRRLEPTGRLGGGGKSGKTYDALLADLKEAVTANKMGLVTEAGPVTQRRRRRNSA